LHNLLVSIAPDAIHLGCRAMQNYARWGANNIKFSISKIVLLSRVYLGKVIELESVQIKSVPHLGANSVSPIGLETTR
jgi:hypothetical protein